MTVLTQIIYFKCQCVHTVPMTCPWGQLFHAVHNNFLSNLTCILQARRAKHTITHLTSDSRGICYRETTPLLLIMCFSMQFATTEKFLTRWNLTIPEAPEATNGVIQTPLLLKEQETDIGDCSDLSNGLMCNYYRVMSIGYQQEVLLTRLIRHKKANK